MPYTQAYVTWVKNDLGNPDIISSNKDKINASSFTCISHAEC